MKLPFNENLHLGAAWNVERRRSHLASTAYVLLRDAPHKVALESACLEENWLRCGGGAVGGELVREVGSHPTVPLTSTRINLLHNIIHLGLSHRRDCSRQIQITQFAGLSEQGRRWPRIPTSGTHIGVPIPTFGPTTASHSRVFDGIRSRPEWRLHAARANTSGQKRQGANGAYRD